VRVSKLPAVSVCNVRGFLARSLYPFTPLSQTLKDGIIQNLNAADDALSSRASGQIYGESLLGIFFLTRRNLHMVGHSNPSNLEHAVDSLDIAFYVRPEVLLRCLDLFSGQKPGQRPHHSSGDCCDHVIQRRRMLLFGLNLVEIFDSTVNPVAYYAGKALNNCFSRRPFFPHDPTDGSVYQSTHPQLLLNRDV